MILCLGLRAAEPEELYQGPYWLQSRPSNWD
jgi:hypothetical protein